jgi:hypothetical protein
MSELQILVKSFITVMLVHFAQVATAQQSLKDRFNKQDMLGSPEYRVLTEEQAWKQVPQGRDINKTWSLITKDNSALFQCGVVPGSSARNMSQPSIWLGEQTYNLCDVSVLGICFSWLSGSKFPFRYIIDSENKQTYILGEYYVKTHQQFGVPPKQAYMNKGQIGSIVSYTPNLGLNPIPDIKISQDSRCELYPIDQELYCTSGVRVNRVDCVSTSKAQVIEQLKRYAFNFIKQRAVAECQSYNTVDVVFKNACKDDKMWKKFSNSLQ